MKPFLKDFSNAIIDSFKDLYGMLLELNERLKWHSLGKDLPPKGVFQYKTKREYLAAQKRIYKQDVKTMKQICKEAKVSKKEETEKLWNVLQ